MIDADQSRDMGAEDGEVAVILAAIDTSRLAGRVVELAARVARRTWPNSQLHLVHVFRSASFDRPSSAGIQREELLDEARQHVDYHARSARRQCPAPVVTHFAEGDPVERVLALARSLSADLVIVGTHDAVGLERFLLGSIANKIAKRAPCSVLMVRDKQRPYIKVSSGDQGD
jgi:universal stress protein A